MLRKILLASVLMLGAPAAMAATSTNTATSVAGATRGGSAAGGCSAGVARGGWATSAVTAIPTAATASVHPRICTVSDPAGHAEADHSRVMAVMNRTRRRVVCMATV